MMPNMGLSLKPDHLKRYSQLTRLLVRYGRSDLVREAGLDEVLTDEETPERPEDAATAEALCADLEALGPTFVKVGQLLSTRVDLLPLSYTEALERLQDDVEPFAYAEVEQIIERVARPRLTGRVAGVALDTFASSLVGVDARGEPLTPCYTYADSRNTAQVAALRAELDEAQVQKKHGVTVVGIKRPNAAFTYTQPGTIVQPDDLLIVIGEVKLVERFAART